MNKVVDIKDKLKLVAHNKKLYKAKADRKGKNAITRLRLYNEECDKLLIIESDLFNKRISLNTHNYIKWLLEEMLLSEPETSVEEIIYSWANYLLEYLKAGNAKVIKPRKNPKNPIPPAK